MKNYKYQVIFFDDSFLEVSAGNATEAAILTQGERIKAGKGYLVKEIYVMQDRGWNKIY
jgi:hypothetical protein